MLKQDRKQQTEQEGQRKRLIFLLVLAELLDLKLGPLQFVNLLINLL